MNRQTNFFCQNANSPMDSTKIVLWFVPNQGIGNLILLPRDIFGVNHSAGGSLSSLFLCTRVYVRQITHFSVLKATSLVQKFTEAFIRMFSLSSQL